MKKQINEIKKMQRLAGLITESEYHESQLSEAKDIPSILRSWKAEKGDRLDYQTVANMIEVGRVKTAAKFILDELDTSIREMIMDIIEENDPKLFDEMFGSEGYKYNAAKFTKSKDIDDYAAAFRVSIGDDYDELAQKFPNLQDPKVKALVLKQAEKMKKQINEIKRMQQLAGLIKESQLNETEETISFGEFKNVGYHQRNDNKIFLTVTESDNFREIENNYEFEGVITESNQITPEFEELKKQQTAIKKQQDFLIKTSNDLKIDRKLIGDYNEALNSLLDAIFKSSYNK